MYPFETDEEVLDIDLEPEEKEYREYGLTENGDIGNFKVSNLEAIKIWVMHAMQTARYRYEIFSENYGSELEELIGTVNDEEYIESELERMVEDCLKENSHVTGISEFTCAQKEGGWICSFRLDTEYGEEVYSNVKI